MAPKKDAPKGLSATELQKERNAAAWAESGSQEDPNLEFNKARAKENRKDVAMPAPGLGQVANHELRVEPPTLKSVVGYSDEKKARLAKAHAKKSPKAKE